jgi:uncharacterized protein YjiS (DUF1127 family)
LRAPVKDEGDFEMTALESTVHANAAPSRVSALAMRVTGLVRRFVRHLANRRHARELMELSDHQLADIGLTRADLAIARRTSFASDPTQCLAEIARQRGQVDDYVRLRM